MKALLEILVAFYFNEVEIAVDSTTCSNDSCFFINTARVMDSDKALYLYCSHLDCMKNRYFRSGGLFELSDEIREELDLEKSQKLVMSKLSSIQVKLVEPLLQYW